MTYSAYPEYKDSGVEWLGVVPAHWGVPKLKHLVRIRNGRDYKIVEVESGGYPVIGSGGEFARANDFLYDGESVLLGRKGTIDKPLYINGPFWTVDTMFYTELSQSVDGRFLYYYATCFQFGQYSTNTALPSMAQEDLVNIYLAVPGPPEQIQIGTFLDHETARIDALIEEQQHLIALLKEKRQTVISHAVTKGLDPDVPMKDSGVEWLGDVPEHWNVRRVSYDFTAVKGSRGAILTKEYCSNHSGPYPVYSGQTDDEGVLGFINDFDFSLGNNGGILTTTVGAKAMSINFVKNKISLSQNCMLIRPISKNILVKFYFHHLQPLFHLERGMIPDHMQPSFRMEDLYSFYVALPPLKDQEKITAFLDHETARIDSLVEEGQSVIRLLKERRSALISAAVTGKIDVRGWQPPEGSATQEASQQEAV